MAWCGIREGATGVRMIVHALHEVANGTNTHLVSNWLLASASFTSALKACSTLMASLALPVRKRRKQVVGCETESMSERASESRERVCHSTLVVRDAAVGLAPGYRHCLRHEALLCQVDFVSCAAPSPLESIFMSSRNRERTKIWIVAAPMTTNGGSLSSLGPPIL